MTLADVMLHWPLHTTWIARDGDRVMVVGYRHERTADRIPSDSWRLLVEHPGRHDCHWVLDTVAMTWLEAR